MRGWLRDGRRMRELGIAHVRIGEFAWSRYEPRRGEFQWGWLDRAMNTLDDAGPKIVLGTPTAAPPKWLMDEHPDIAPVDDEGRPRGFGSRRHYTFSSQVWRESARIVGALAERHGRHSALVGWQIVRLPRYGAVVGSGGSAISTPISISSTMIRSSPFSINSSRASEKTIARRNRGASISRQQR